MTFLNPNPIPTSKQLMVEKAKEYRDIELGRKATVAGVLGPVDRHMEEEGIVLFRATDGEGDFALVLRLDDGRWKVTDETEPSDFFHNGGVEG